MTPELSTGPRRRVEALVFVTVFLDLVGFGIVIPLLPFYVESMGGSARTVGVLLGCFSFTQLLATPWLGRLSDRRGRKPVILLSLFANAAAMLLFALASHLVLLPLLFTSRILAGATSGNIAACQAAVADCSTPETRAQAMGKIGAGIGLGLVLGPLVGGLASDFGPAFPPLAAGALAFLGALGVLTGMPETHPPQARAHRWQAFLATPNKRALGLVLALYFLVFLAMTTLQVALALLAKARFGWDSRQVGYVFALQGAVSLVIQGGLIGPITKALGEVPVLVAGTLLFGAGLWGVGASGQPPALVVSVAVMATGLGLTQPLLSSVASQAASEGSHGLILGLAQSSGGLARTVGPVAAGALYASLDSSAPFRGGALVAALAAGLALLLRREGIGRPRRPDRSAGA